MTPGSTISPRASISVGAPGSSGAIAAIRPSSMAMSAWRSPVGCDQRAAADDEINHQRTRASTIEEHAAGGERRGHVVLVAPTRRDDG